MERRNDRADRRAPIVHLTAAGRKPICAFAGHESAMERAARGLSAAGWKRAAETLEEARAHGAIVRCNAPTKNRALSSNE